MTTVADFTQSETLAIETTLKKRWPQHIELQIHADKETMKREITDQK